MVSPCHHTVEGFTKIRYIIYKGNISSIYLCFVLNFLLIHLYVPALTPRIHCSESALQFAENMVFAFLCRERRGIICEESKMTSRAARASFMYRLYLEEPLPFTKTLNFLSVRKEAISLMKIVENSDNWYSRPQRRVSKVFSIFKNTTAIDILLLKFRVTCRVVVL
jgi:hypothetical protein